RASRSSVLRCSGPGEVTCGVAWLVGADLPASLTVLAWGCGSRAAPVPAPWCRRAVMLIEESIGEGSRPVSVARWTLDHRLRTRRNDEQGVQVVPVRVS